MLRALVCVSRWLEGRSTLPLERMEGRKGADQKLRRYLLSGFVTSSLWHMVDQSEEKFINSLEIVLNPRVERDC